MNIPIYLFIYFLEKKEEREKRKDRIDFWLATRPKASEGNSRATGQYSSLPNTLFTCSRKQASVSRAPEGSVTLQHNLAHEVLAPSSGLLTRMLTDRSQDILSPSGAL